jgi:hypothetical protein
MLALFLAGAIAAAATAEVAVVPRQVPVSLRVVGAGGKVLAEEKLRTEKTTKVSTSPKATCLGAGTGGTGKPATVVGATPLGALGQAARSTAALRPLLITDHFSFGLGLCGVGGSVSTPKSGLSWYLKVNHVDPERGGDSVQLGGGDEVLWALAPYPYPSELALQAPRKASAGKPFTVRVFSYADDGTRSPAVGARVTGATGPTAADGTTTVVLSKPERLIAREPGAIPSNRRPVCVSGKCPADGSKPSRHS